MDVDVLVALEEMRPVVAFEPNWREVLDRAGPVSRGRRRVGLKLLVPTLAAVAAIVVAATPAFGLHGKLLSFFDLSRSAQVGQTWQQAGPKVRPTAALLAAARLTHVEPQTLRRIAAGGSGYRRVALVGGIGPDKTAWLGQTGQGWVSNFFPLFGSVGELDRSAWRTRTAHGWDGTRFPMYARSDAERQLFVYAYFGGPVASRVSWATLVGFVRPDVARLVVHTASGAARRVPLTGDGGFAYAAIAAGDLPRRVFAYNAKGRLVSIEGFALRPLTS